MTSQPNQHPLKLRRYFPALWSILLLIGAIHSTAALLQLGLQYSWMGALFGCLAVPLALSPFILGKRARSDENLSTLHMLTAIAPMLILYDLLQGNRAGMWPLVYAVIVAYGGTLLYLYWYSKPQRPRQAALEAGQLLPSPLLAIKPADQKWIVMIGQGQWSGLCRAQQSELLQLKAELAPHNAAVSCLIPGQMIGNATSKIPGERADLATQTAESLGLIRRNGTPFPYEYLGATKNSPWPTLLVVNEAGRILFSDQPENSRLRAEPEQILAVLEAVKHG